MDVSEKLVLYTVNRNASADATTFTIADQRGRHVPHKKTTEELHDGVRTHINQFPVMEPHYTRAGTQRRFLGAELNINRMYVLYKEECKQKCVDFVKPGVYRNIFCNEFNLSFHQPKKDVCVKCEQYNNATDIEKQQLEEEYRLHIES